MGIHIDEFWARNLYDKMCNRRCCGDFGLNARTQVFVDVGHVMEKM